MELDPDLQAMLDERNRTMGLFTADHRPMAFYAILREDLEMPPGKIGAQASHAFEEALKEAKKGNPDIEAQYQGTGHGKKNLHGAKNLAQLIKGYRAAQAAGLPCALVIDRGHVLPPHFTGAPIFTALGIGPVYEDEARKIMNRFSRLRDKEQQ